MMPENLRLGARMERTDTVARFRIRLEDGSFLADENGGIILMTHHMGRRWLERYRAGLSMDKLMCLLLGIETDDLTGAPLQVEYELKHQDRPYQTPIRLRTQMKEPERVRSVNAKDIFDYLYGLRLSPNAPKRVYVLGGGVRGVDEYHRIPKSAHVYSCNSSALAMKRPPTLAFFFDRRCDNQPWWDKSFKVKTKRVYSSYLAARLPCRYYFRFTPHLFEVPYQCLISGRLRGGCNCAGVAMQAAFWAGATEIVLCGVEMLDLGHWDGTQAGVAGADGLWPQIGTVNGLIRELEKFGLYIWSLNDTALDVDIIRDHTPKIKKLQKKQIKV